jgi:ABC-type transporter Mla MlaB component
MGATAPETVTFAVRGPITRADLRGLRDRVCALMSQCGGADLVCDVHGVEPDAVAVDALCRLQLAAQRHGCKVRLQHASAELLEVVAFMGLTEALPQESGHADRPVDPAALS